MTLLPTNPPANLMGAAKKTATKLAIMRGTKIDNPVALPKHMFPVSLFNRGTLFTLPNQTKNTETASLRITPPLLSGPHSRHQDHPFLAALKELGRANIHGKPQTLAHHLQSLTLLVVWSDNPDLFCRSAKRQQLFQIILHDTNLINILPRW